MNARDLFRLEGQVALVTGGALGIGRALSLGLAQAGAAVAVVDLPAQAAPAASLCEEITQAGGQARAYGFDVCETSGIPALIEQVVQDFGRLDILVNNAGTGISQPAMEVTESDWDRIINLNLRSVFFFAQAAGRYMATRGSGRIINMCSTHALIALANGSPYIASKGGVASLTRSLALELVRHGVLVNAIAPGPVETDFKRAADLRLGRTEASIREDMQRRIPLGRRLQPQELVGPTLLLASAAGAAMVGHVLVVDGGQVIH